MRFREAEGVVTPGLEVSEPLWVLGRWYRWASMRMARLGIESGLGLRDRTLRSSIVINAQLLILRLRSSNSANAYYNNSDNKAPLLSPQWVFCAGRVGDANRLAFAFKNRNYRRQWKHTRCSLIFLRTFVRLNGH